MSFTSASGFRSWLTTRPGTPPQADSSGHLRACGRGLPAFPCHREQPVPGKRHPRGSRFGSLFLTAAAEVPRPLPVLLSSTYSAKGFTYEQQVSAIVTGARLTTLQRIRPDPQHRRSTCPNRDRERLYAERAQASSITFARRYERDLQVKGRRGGRRTRCSERKRVSKLAVCAEEVEWLRSTGESEQTWSEHRRGHRSRP